MKGLKLLGLLTLITMFIACGKSSKKEPKEAEVKIKKAWKTLNEPNYSISYPDTLDLRKPGIMGSSLMLFSKPTSQQDRFRENVNLTIQNLSGMNIDLDKFVYIGEDQVKNLITDGNLIESKRLSIKNKNFHKFIYTGRQGKFNLKWLQYCCIKNEKAYVITLTCELKQFNKYAPIAEEMIKTFTAK
ncbi:MAG: hypothetical protein KGV59_06650 [Tenacibaculum sp.]|nr:hypothetical protein [Tenacibaculum sp.]